MVDIEALGSAPGSAILSIGAVEFDPHGEGYGEWFYAGIDPEASIKAGFTVDGDTLRWWAQQNDDARAAAFAGKEAPDSALRQLTMWGNPWNETELWAHGATYDPVLLDAAFRKYGWRPPWKYQNVRDTRTLFALVPGYYEWVKSQPISKAHHALEDAKAQARWVQKALAMLKQANG